MNVKPINHMLCEAYAFNQSLGAWVVDTDVAVTGMMKDATSYDESHIKDSWIEQSR